jgi:hypothetical protein
MKYVALFCAALVGFSAHAAAAGKQEPTANTLSAEQQHEGWKLLFDGKSTAGWHRYNQKTIGPAWSVADDALHLDASHKHGFQSADGGDIVNDGMFANFHLKLDWKIAPAGNSGVMFYVQEDAQHEYPWQTGIESQVLDNVAAEDAHFDKHRAGDLYDLIAGKPEAVRPAGEWNRLEIISDHGRFVEKLNGTVVVETTLWDEAWKKLIAGSKFRSMAGFGMFRSGKIALQDHGADVWFRNIMIRELK